MNQQWLYFIYGLCTMFFGVTAWRFWLRRKEGVLPRLIVAMLSVMVAQCVKDLIVTADGWQLTQRAWNLMSGADMVIIPFYAIVLMELCRPSEFPVTKTLTLHEIPFLVLWTAYLLIDIDGLYYALIAWGAGYGTYYFIWTLRNIPRYNLRIRNEFSFTEDIDLHWLRSILLSFFAILALWIADCFVYLPWLELAFMTSNLIIWMLITYYLERHRTVLAELHKNVKEVEETKTEDRCRFRIQFNSIASFCRYFSKVYGCSAVEYRKNIEE